MSTQTFEQKTTTYNTKIADLVHIAPQVSTGYADTFVFEPTNPAEEQLGKLLLVIEIEQRSKATKDIIDAIATVMQHEYYKLDEYESNTQIDAEQKFEHAVNKTNEILADIAAQGKSDWINHTHAVIATQVGDHLYLTRTGEAKAILFRGTQAIDISDGLYDKSESQNPLKTFANVASGFINEQDKIMVGTPGIFKGITFESIYKTTLKYAPTTIATRLHATLQAQSTPRATAALFFELLPEADPLQTAPNPTTTKKIESTHPEQALTPRSQQSTSSAADEFKEILQSETLPEPQTQQPSSVADKPYQTNNAKVSKATALLATITSVPAAAIKKLGKSKAAPDESKTTRKALQEASPHPARKKPSIPRLSNKMNRRLPSGAKRRARRIASTSGSGIKGIVGSIGNLPLPAKLAIGGVIPVLALFIITTSFRAGDNQQQAINDLNATALASAQQSLEDARVALIVGDKSEARQLLEQAKEQQQDVEDPTGEFASQLTSLESEINTELDKVNGITRLSGGLPTIPLASPTTALAITEENIYAIDEAGTSATEIDLTSNTTNPIKTTSDVLGKIEHAIYFERGDEIILTSNDPSLAILDTTSQDIAEQTPSPFESDQIIQDLAQFSNKLYVLDPANNQIFSHLAASSGFGKGVEWITDNTNISTASSFAIDGNIYVLTTQGSVIKFFQGEREQFEIATTELSIPLENPTQITASENTTSLAIADPSNNRILLIDKQTGTIQSQLVTDDFATISDMAILETETTPQIIALTESGIYRINIATPTSPTLITN